MTGSSFYGWRLLAVFWIVLMISSALPLYAGGVLNAYMFKDLSVDRSVMAWPMAILQFVFGLGALLTALLVRKIGVRLSLSLGGLLGAAGALAMAFLVTSGVQAALVFGLVVGSGFCVAGGIPTQVGVTRWFTRRRALALAILFTAPGVGGFTAAPLMNRFMLAVDGEWRQGWLIAVGGFLLVSLLAFFFVKEDPADIGQQPDGMGKPQAAGEKASGPEAAELRPFITREAWSSADVYRNWVYWSMLIAGLGVNIGFTLYFAIGIVHLQDLGHSATAGSWALGVFAISALIAKFILGAFGDRFDPRQIWAGMIATYAIGVFLVGYAESPTVLMMFPVFMGIGYGGHIGCMMAVLSNYYGREAFPAIVGVAVAVTTCAGAIAPMFAGQFQSAFGGFSMAFLSLGAWCGFGALAMAALPRPTLRA